MVEVGSRGEPEPDTPIAPDDMRAAPDETAEVLGTGSASGPRRRLPAAAPVYGWGLAAALALAAPFAAVNTLEVHYPNGRVLVPSVDGWGRDHPHQTLQLYGHGVRFGIAMWACALALMAAAVLFVMATRAADGAALRRRAMLAAIAAPSALAGVVASLVLYAQSFIDQRDAISAGRTGLTAGEAVYRPGYGNGVWLSVAAVVIAVLSSSLFLRRLLLEPAGDRARLDVSGP